MTNWVNESRIEILPGTVLASSAPKAHEIQGDIEYIDAFLFETAVDPADMIDKSNEWDKLSAAPPTVSGYRDADIQGVACWNCAHFCVVGDPDNDGDLDGICELWESQAEATKTCDRFTAHADLLRQAPHTSWTEDMQNMQQDAMGPGVAEVDYSDQSSLNEIFLSSEAREDEGLVWKEIMRTGEWKQIPTNKGILNRQLRIIRDGESDPANGVISLSEIHDNFEARAVPYVTIPLSDDVKDHKNIARLNTGFVRKLKIADRDGMSVLLAGMDFTEPDVKEKVLRGTIPDVSAGVPFGVTRRKDKKFFRTVLDHVCLTAKPFMDGLGPFGLAAADDDAELRVESWQAEEEKPEPAPEPTQPETRPALSFVEQQTVISNALRDHLRLATDYQVEDINSETGIVVVSHKVSGARWNVEYKLTGNSENPVSVATVDNWKLIEESPKEPEQVAASEPVHPLKRAQELRELRLSQPTSTTGGIQMSVLSLDGVELSDLPEEARKSIQSVLDENARLHRTTRESEVSKRITELEAIGLKDRPGALKLYRDVMLSDDGGPAIVLFADDQDANKHERLTAVAVLDRFIDALKGDGGVQFSDQALQSGNDNPPPKNADGEKAPLEERVEASKKALYGSGKRSGRK